MAKTTQIQVRCDEETKATLRRLATERDMSVSEFVLTRCLKGAPAMKGEIAGAIGDEVDLEAAAQKIRNSEGVPMSVARRLARERAG